MPLSGFIEWSKVNEKKVPYYFTRADSEDIFCPAIHDAGQFTILTRDATPQNAKIHHRQPVIISKSQINNYFNLFLNSQVEKIISNIIYIYAFNVWIEDNNSMDKTMASIGNAFDNINKVKSFIKKG